MNNSWRRKKGFVNSNNTHIAFHLEAHRIWSKKKLVGRQIMHGFIGFTIFILSRLYRILSVKFPVLFPMPALTFTYYILMDGYYIQYIYQSPMPFIWSNFVRKISRSWSGQLVNQYHPHIPKRFKQMSRDEKLEEQEF